MEPRLDGHPAHLADWPCIHAGFAHEGDSEAISAARRFTGGFLARVQGEHGVPVPVETVETAQLVVSELITNTCKYAPGPGLLDLEVDVDTATLLVSVWDTSSTLPLARAAEPGRIGQHGLEIILALCEGYDVQRQPVGKRITVRISLEPRTR
ncbi:ATP-binding protein [Streptomyces sp. NPDC001902]|nr:ATP-binding protein [Streptomyces sp. PA03-1a]MDX2709710.1 ATP-binding protein [Streptomyces sp. PA03-6a]MDX2819473.1 ATP-binding protein [Streptomyces sp. PA03-5A]